VVSFTPRPLYSRERAPATQWIEGWMGGGEEKNSQPLSGLEHLIIQRYTSELPRLLYSGKGYVIFNNAWTRHSYEFCKCLFHRQELLRILSCSFLLFVFTPPLFKVIILTPCSRVLLEKLTVTKLVKISPAFYGTRSFITVFTKARIPRAGVNISKQAVFLRRRDVRPSPTPTSWRSTTYLTVRNAYSTHSLLSSTSAGHLLHPKPEDASSRGDKDPHTIPVHC
jgi:hypothetical protein